MAQGTAPQSVVNDQFSGEPSLDSAIVEVA
jgi:hypothetical protein